MSEADAWRRACVSTNCDKHPTSLHRIVRLRLCSLLLNRAVKYRSARAHDALADRCYFFFTRCVRAEAATLFAAALDFGLLRILAAFDATAFEVTSFLLAMGLLLSVYLGCSGADGEFDSA